MTAAVLLTPLHPGYPSRLRSLPSRPLTLRVRGGSLEADHVVAVVGSRAAAPEARTFAHDFAYALARAGSVVASGGAEGIDAAAHMGALHAGGRTWAVAGTGFGRCYPSTHADLFHAIGNGPGAMVWPFPDGYQRRSAFLARNRVLVALADAVVIVQAGLDSGALHAARCATALGRAVWVVPAFPWAAGFEGSRQLLDKGAICLTSSDRFIASLGASPGVDAAPSLEPAVELSPVEMRVLSAVPGTPLHADLIAVRAHQSAQATTAALLTLALENVVVEGPPGFFRRREPS